MAVKHKGAAPDHPLRKYVVSRRKGAANRAGNDNGFRPEDGAIKRKLDAVAAAKEARALCKEVWDD